MERKGNTSLLETNIKEGEAQDESGESAKIENPYLAQIKELMEGSGRYENAPKIRELKMKSSQWKKDFREGKIESRTQAEISANFKRLEELLEIDIKEDGKVKILFADRGQKVCLIVGAESKLKSVDQMRVEPEDAEVVQYEISDISGTINNKELDGESLQQIMERYEVSHFVNKVLTQNYIDKRREKRVEQQRKKVSVQDDVADLFR